MMATVRTSPISRPVRFVLLLVMLLLSSESWSAEILGRVVGITDGDTITVLDDERNQHKIRLAYIDAPERRQAFGNQARRLLADLAFGRSASVEQFGRDRYGQVIGCDHRGPGHQPGHDHGWHGLARLLGPPGAKHAPGLCAGRAAGQGGANRALVSRRSDQAAGVSCGAVPGVSSPPGHLTEPTLSR